MERIQEETEKEIKSESNPEEHNVSSTYNHRIQIAIPRKRRKMINQRRKESQSKTSILTTTLIQ